MDLRGIGMAAILVALVVGGVAAAALLWPHGWGYMLLGAPLGGSGLALLVALYRFARRSARRRDVRDELRTGPQAAEAKTRP